MLMKIGIDIIKQSIDQMMEDECIVKEEVLDDWMDKNEQSIAK